MPESIPFATEPLGKGHDRAGFSCGKKALDDYLKRQAGQDGRKNLARLFILPGEEANVIAGYYSLSSLSMNLADLPEDMARKLPRYPDLPGALIGRLAVDRRYQGRGLGEVLLLDALKRIAILGGEIAVHSVVVEPIDEQAATFYRKFGFLDIARRADRLFLPIDTARRLAL